MTRKDYNLIARAIWLSPLMETDRIDAGLAIAEALAETNPRFDAARFVEACRCGRGL